MNERMRENVKETTKKVLLITTVGVAFALGAKVQKRITLKQLRNTRAFVETTPMFPLTMPLSKIKEIVKNIPDATFSDALVVTIGNVQRIIIRDVL